MMKKIRAYSDILQDFAAPLLHIKDNGEEFVSKLKVAELIWNYCITEDLNLPISIQIEKAIQESNKLHPEWR